MANTRKSMRKIRHVLKLAREAGLTQRQIARSLAMSPTTVGEYLRRAEMAGIAWPLPGDWDDGMLEARLFPALPKAEREARPLPDWAEVHREYQRKGVTLVLLWEEYKAAHPHGIEYSQYCDRYRAWAGDRPPITRTRSKVGFPYNPDRGRSLHEAQTVHRETDHRHPEGARGGFRRG